jgi:energy-coupling factor transporter ATP-binding protein EcfA2
MTEHPSLDTFVTVNPRFARSVSITRDTGRKDALDGYILTPNGRDMLRRMASALHGETSTRAWSLTGPYGSGKSSLALLIAQLLSGDDGVRQQARRFLSASDADLSSRLFGAGSALAKKPGRLLPVLVTGSRQPLDKALAASLAASLRAVATRGRPPQIIERLERVAAAPGAAGSAVVEMFEEAVEYLSRVEGEAAGLLLIVDELGKFLEFGASNPEQGDVFVLQELAEAATRSARPFLFVTILHQALDRYAEHLSPGRRSEWAKVQGRFDDVAFEERSEQLLRLLSHAVRHEGSDADLKAFRRQAKVHAQEAVAAGIRAAAMPTGELQDCLAACYPLHPLTAVVLGPLFRQLAQNERSLFAFLASSETHGFREFLNQNTVKDGPYRLDCLYDYVMASLGPGVFAQHRGKLWAEVQTALDRLHDATDVQVRLAKTIGLLQALGPAAGFPASSTVLVAALRGLAGEGEVEAALKELSRRSVVVFRRHTGSYALWEGSDVDIEDRLQAARQSVERDQSIAAFLTRQIPPQPLIARRHYFQTGTLRYFEAVYGGRSDLQADLFSGLTGGSGEADGRVLYCLPRDPSDRKAMREQITSSGGEVPVVAALPGDVFDLRELCHELVCLRWVSEHTPELETDRTARREVSARLAIAEQNLRSHLEWVFSPVNPGCTWFCRGVEVKLASARQLNDTLSRACDEVYHATPRWRNELINRRALSSSAAAARRNLIEAMFEHPEKEALGFEGNPPERSMYETLLRGARLHRKQGGEFAFTAPDKHADPAVREVWKAVEAFLTETEAGKKSVEHLFTTLRQPPFGLKDGVLPVILAAVLVHAHSQVALYEEGSFVPRPSAAVFERLFRTPAKYELQRFRIAGPRAEVFQQYAAMIQRAAGDEADLLTIVKPMVRLAKELPDYVAKTRQISETGQKVLKAVRDARQPDKLLFADLPVACGHPPFEASGKADPKQIDAYFTQLRAAFTELQRAYPHLLADIERLTLKAFGEEPPFAAARKRIDHHARLVLNVAVEAKLKAFLLRITDDSVEEATWLESIATLLAGKPPTHWDDQDRARFEVQLAAAARNFEHYRVLALEMEKTGHALLDGDKTMLLVSITAPDRGGVEKVVQVPPELVPNANRVREEVRRVLREEKLLDRKDVSVAILAELVRQLLSNPEKVAE